jgi:hypothetical protein
MLGAAIHPSFAKETSSCHGCSTSNGSMICVINSPLSPLEVIHVNHIVVIIRFAESQHPGEQ